MGDRLILHDIEVSCRLGVYEWEQEKPQPVWIDVELAIDAAKAARRDDVRDALDYASVVTAVKTLAEHRAYKLLETLAEAIAAHVLREQAVAWVRVRIKKTALPGVGYAAVEIERARPSRAPRRRRGRRGSPAAAGGGGGLRTPP